MRAEADPSMLGMQIVVTASLIEEAGNWETVVEIIKRYSLYSWQALLSRGQELVLGDNITEPTRIVATIKSFFGSRLATKIEKLAREHPNSDKMLMLTPDILGILQQAAFQFAPVECENEFDTEDAREDTGRAVLIVAEILHGENGQSSLKDIVFEVARQSHRVGRSENWRVIGRSIEQFKIGEDSDSPTVNWFRDEFQRANGVSLEDYYLGGFLCFIKIGAKSLEEIQSDWMPVFPIAGSELEKALVKAYLKIRSCSVQQIKNLIESIEQGSPRSWTLIPLQKFPIVNWEGDFHLPLHPTNIANSIFDGVYYSLIDFYRTIADKRQREVSIQNLGNKYGDLIEEYVERLLRTIFGDRLIKLPVSEVPNRKRCDFAVKYDNRLILFEIKTARFTAPKYYSCQTPQDLEILIGEKVEVKDATQQIFETIEDLRAGKIKHPDLSGLDWTISTIFPVIVSEESLPSVPLAWDTIYSKFDEPLRSLDGGAGRVGYLRFLTVEDIFILIDVSNIAEIARLLSIWGQQDNVKSNSLRNFLISQGYKLQSTYVLAAYEKVRKLVTLRLGL